MSNTTGDKIKYYRKKEDLTMKELADKIGVAESTISYWESGKSSPRMDKVEKMSHIFNIDPSVLVFGDEPTASNTTKWDDETLEMLEEVHKTPELRMLFKATKNLSPEDIKKTVEMIKIFKGGDDD